MECHIIDVKPYRAQILLGHGAFLGGPLEAGHHGVLDLIEILHSLGTVHQDVGPGAVRTEAPDLTRLCHVIFVLIAEVAGAGLEVVTWVDFALF